MIIFIKMVFWCGQIWSFNIAIEVCLSRWSIFEILICLDRWNKLIFYDKLIDQIFGFSILYNGNNILDTFFEMSHTNHSVWIYVNPK